MTASLDPVRRLTIESACAQLVARYGVYYDNLEFEAWLGLWARNAEWHLPARAPIIGREALRDFLDTRPKPGPIWRHMAANVCIDVVDEKTATGESYVIIYHADRPADGSPGKLELPDSIVQFRDRYTFEDGQWLFAERRTTRVLKS